MATAYFKSRNYNQFIPPIDIATMVQTMAANQQSFDENYAAIQGQIDGLGQLDIIKEEDQAYLYSKVKSLVDNINTYGRGEIDLSSKGISTQISNNIRQALDSNVVNAISNTQKVRAFQEEVKTLKEKHPEKYSVVNEVYGFRPVNDWLSDGKVGSNMSTTPKYTPFSDVHDKYTKMFEKMSTAKGDEKIQIKDGQGGIIETTYRGLKPTDIKDIVYQMLTPEEQNQLNINGWYSMGNGDADYARLKYKEHTLTKGMELDGDIKLLEADKAKYVVGSAQHTKLDSDIKKLQSERASYNVDDATLAKLSPEVIGGYFEREKLVSGLQFIHQRHLTSEEFKNDQPYWEQKKYDLDVLKFNLEQFKATKAADETTTPGAGVIQRVLYNANNLENVDLVESALKEVNNVTTSLGSVTDEYGRKQWGTSWGAVKKSIENRAEATNQDYDELVFQELTKQKFSLKDGADMKKFRELLDRKADFREINSELEKTKKVDTETIKSNVRSEIFPQYGGQGKALLSQYVKDNPTDKYAVSYLSEKGVFYAADKEALTNRMVNYFTKKAPKTYLDQDAIKNNLKLKQMLTEAVPNPAFINQASVSSKNKNYATLSRLMNIDGLDKDLDISIIKEGNAYVLSQPDKVDGEGNVTKRVKRVPASLMQQYAPELALKENAAPTKTRLINIPATTYYEKADVNNVLAELGAAQAPYVMAEDAKKMLKNKVTGYSEADAAKVKQAIDIMVDNASDFKVRSEAQAGKSGDILVTVYKGTTPVASAPFSKSDYQAIAEVGKVHPQYLITSVLDFEVQDGTVSKNLQNLLTLYTKP